MKLCFTSTRIQICKKLKFGIDIYVEKRELKIIVLLKNPPQHSELYQLLLTMVYFLTGVYYDLSFTCRINVKRKGRKCETSMTTEMKFGLPGLRFLKRCSF